MRPGGEDGGEGGQDHRGRLELHPVQSGRETEELLLTMRMAASKNMMAQKNILEK